MYLCSLQALDQKLELRKSTVENGIRSASEKEHVLPGRISKKNRCGPNAVSAQSKTQMTAPADARDPHHTIGMIMIASPNATDLSSDLLLPRPTFESFFLEVRHLGLIIHAGLTPVLRITNATPGRGIGVYIGGKIFRCATRQAQSRFSLTRFLWCVWTSEGSARVGEPGVLIQ